MAVDRVTAVNRVTSADKLADRSSLSYGAGCGKQFKRKGSITTNYNIFGVNCRVFNKTRPEVVTFFAKRVGPKLRAVLEEAAADHKSVYSVVEEITLARDAATPIVAIYEKLRYDPPEGIPKQQLDEMLVVAGRSQMTAMDELTRLIERGARIVSLEADKLHPHIIDEVMKQVMRFVQISFPNDMEGLKRFDQLLTEELQLPSLNDGRGTTITPDQQVMAMDSTIPYVADDEED